MFSTEIINGFRTTEDSLYIGAHGSFGLSLYFEAEMQKKAFVELHLDDEPDWVIQERFGGEEGLRKEAEELFCDELFEKKFEKILRAMADQSVGIKEVRLNLIKKTLIH